MTLILYELGGLNNRRYSLYSWRARYALAHKGLVAECRPVRISDNVNAGKRQDIGRHDVRPDLLDVAGAAADFEDAAFGTAVDQLLKKVPVQQPQRFFLFPYRAVGDLPRVKALAIV